MSNVAGTDEPEILDAKARGKWCTLVRQERRFEPGARLLLWEIAEHVHRGRKYPRLTGYCWASQETLGELIGVKERAASAYISQGKELGYLRGRRRQRDTGLIWLTWPPGFDPHAGACLNPPSDPHAGAHQDRSLIRTPASFDPHENVSLMRTGVRPTLEKTFSKTFLNGRRANGVAPREGWPNWAPVSDLRPETLEGYVSTAGQTELEKLQRLFDHFEKIDWPVDPDFRDSIEKLMDARFNDLVARGVIEI